MQLSLPGGSGVAGGSAIVSVLALLCQLALHTPSEWGRADGVRAAVHDVVDAVESCTSSEPCEPELCSCDPCPPPCEPRGECFLGLEAGVADDWSKFTFIFVGGFFSGHGVQILAALACACLSGLSWIWERCPTRYVYIVRPGEQGRAVALMGGSRGRGRSPTDAPALGRTTY